MNFVLNDPDQLQDVLNRLLAVCRDGQHGFETAANAMKEPALKAELLQYSTQRQEFAVELKSALVGIGEEPADRSSLAGALHQGWIELKSAVGSNSSHAILAECERGEDSAVRLYREALNHGLSEPIHGIIETQFDAIQRVHDRIRSLRDLAEGA